MASIWSPTQQVRALLLLHELSALLAMEARIRTLHGCPHLATQLAAVGKRTLPQTLCEMTEWSALRLAGSREVLRTAITQFTGSAAWAERVTADVVTMLRQGDRFAGTAQHIDDLARAIAATDEVKSMRWFENLLARMHEHRREHAEEDAAAAQDAWSPAIELLLKSAGALALNVTPPPSVTERTGRPPSIERALASSSTPYQPSSATEPGPVAGGSHALRRRG